MFPRSLYRDKGHEILGKTPFRAVFGVDTLGLDAELKLWSKVDGNTVSHA